MKYHKLVLVCFLVSILTTILSACSSTTKEDTVYETTETVKPAEPPVVEEVAKVESIREEKQPVVQTKPQIVNYIGHVGTYPIHMSLTFSGNDITGYYSYDSQKQKQRLNPIPNLELVGTVSGAKVELFTTDGGEKFSGIVEENRIYGDWFYRDKTLSFEVTDKKAIQPQTNELFKYTGELSLSFSSGAGGWQTELYIFEDGSFEGVYEDAEYSPSDENPEHYTILRSQFSGKFSVKKKIDDYTYLLNLDNIQYTNKVGTEEYTEDFKYVYTSAAGLDSSNGSSEFIFCLPGKPQSELSEGVLTWINLYDGETDPTETLPLYALYNVDGDEAFKGYSEY